MKSGVDIIGESRDNTIIEDPITFNSVGNATLRDVYAKERITVNYGYSTYIYKVKSSHMDQFGIDAKGSSPDVDRFYSNISPNYGYGVYGHNSAYPEISSSYFTNKTYAIYASSYSDADIYDTYFCQQNDYDIYASTGSYVDASDEDNTFSGDPDEYTHGNVDYPEAWEDCGLGKRVPSQPLAEKQATPASEKEIQDDPVLNDYRSAVKSYQSARAVLRNDFENGKSTKASDYESDYNNAIDQFKAVVENYPDTPSCIRAMGRVTTCYWELEQPESVADYIHSLLQDTRYDKSRPYAEDLLIPYHLHNKDYLAALELSDKIMEESGKSQLPCEALYGKGLIYKYYVKDEKKADEMFKKIIDEYPENPTSLSARAELGETAEEYFASDSAAVTESYGFDVQNYPNPFNPETTLRFNLPQAGRLLLKIYDIRGREVVTLLDADQSAGMHTITWNSRDRLGREVASGVYFYRLQFEGQVRSGKMVLMR